MPLLVTWSAIVVCALASNPITFKVTAPGGGPAGTVFVTVYDPVTKEKVLERKTDRFGKFTTDDVPKEMREIWVQAYDPVNDLTGKYRGQVKKEIDIELKSNYSQVSPGECMYELVRWPEHCLAPLIAPCQEMCVPYMPAPECLPILPSPGCNSCFGFSVEPRLRQRPLLDALEFVPYGTPSDRVMR